MPRKRERGSEGERERDSDTQRHHWKPLRHAETETRRDRDTQRHHWKPLGFKVEEAGAAGVLNDRKAGPTIEKEGVEREGGGGTGGRRERDREKERRREWGIEKQRE